MSNLNIHKASGPDKISAKFLKESCDIDIIAPTLPSIFQLSLETGIVPDDWKIAYITPIFKSGNRTHPCNYRPISLLSLVMEHIIASIYCMAQILTGEILTNFQQFVNIFPIKIFRLVSYLYEMNE